jgi:hypothetical protein
MPGSSGPVERLGGDLRQAELLSPFEVPTGPTSATAFRVDALKKIMPIPEQRYGRWGADYYLAHLSALLGEVIYHPEIGAYYRVHGGNAFQQSSAVLDLNRIRREIDYQLITLDSLSRLADRLELDYPSPIVSMSNVSLRVISRKLDPFNHPVREDRLLKLLGSAVTAARRRRDLPPARRIIQVAGLLAICISPRPLATKLARLVVFPELRFGWRVAPRIRGIAALRGEG